MTAPRYIEESFPIVQLNPLSARERNWFKPIYKMHKWFARRSSSIFRAILLAAALPARGEDGEPIDLMEEFYKGHADDPRLRRPDGKPLKVLDPFMGGGTTVVEALRLGFEVVGIDYNPIAWFIVKGMTAPVDLDELDAAYERVAAKVKDKLLDMYRTRCPVTGDEADIIYAFWVKQGICVDPTCKGVTDLFKGYVVGRIQGDLGVWYFPDIECRNCGVSFDWENERCTITAGGAQILGKMPAGKKSSRDQMFAFGLPEDGVACPSCDAKLTLSDLPYKPKRKKKKVLVQVLVDPSTGDFFEVRGELPDEVVAPKSGHAFEPKKGPAARGKFHCVSCGRIQAIVESAQANGRPLPFKYYGFYAHAPHASRDAKAKARAAKLGLPTNNDKWFAAITAYDLAKIDTAEEELRARWEELPLPTQEIPEGRNFRDLRRQAYLKWTDLYGPRQLFGTALLLEAIAGATGESRDALLGAFQSFVDYATRLCRFNILGNKVESTTSAHDYRNPTAVAEVNLWGTGPGRGTYSNYVAKYLDGLASRDVSFAKSGAERPHSMWHVDLRQCSATSLDIVDGDVDVVVTDPPYAGAVQYAEMSDLSYTWLTRVLQRDYSEFAPEVTLKSQEIIEDNRSKHPAWYFEQLTEAWRECRRVLKDDGLLVFTFHHKEGDRWTGLLKSLFDAGFYLVAAYPTHSEALNSIVIQATKGITYDIIHVCRKREKEVTTIPWTLLRKRVQKEARELLAQIEKSGDPLPSPDVWMILLGKSLHLFSQHYGKVLDHDGSALTLEDAMARLRVLVREVRGESLPLPGALEDVDGLTKVYLLHVAGKDKGWTRDGLHKELRGYAHGPDDLKSASLIRSDPHDKYRWVPVAPLGRGEELENRRHHDLVDRMHQLLAKADRGEDVEAVLRTYGGRSLIAEGLRYLAKRDTSVRDLAKLICRVIDDLGGEDEATNQPQLGLF